MPMVIRGALGYPWSFEGHWGTHGYSRGTGSNMHSWGCRDFEGVFHAHFRGHCRR